MEARSLLQKSLLPGGVFAAVAGLSALLATAPPRAALAAGVGVAASSALVAWQLAERRRRLASEILGRTRDLAEANVILGRQAAERMRAEKALQRTQFAVDHCGDAVLWLEAPGRFVYVNHTACRTLGYNREELLGLLPGDVFADFPPEAWPEQWERFKQRESFRMETRLRTKQGRAVAVEIDVTFLVFGGTEYLCVFAREIEARKRAEAELQAAKDAAVSANEAKSHFLANMSHEIRTPLTAILGYADLIADPRQTHEERVESIETIRRNGDHLLQVISDILDLSKIEAGRMVLESIPCSPVWVVEDVASAVRARASCKGLRLSVAYEGPLPQTITTDPTRLRQILLNLVSNAVKFTESGEVAIRVRMTEGGDGARIEFEVADTGIGMSDLELGRLFEAFSQGDESTARRFGGTGLGLAITRRLTHLLGGEIRVDSAPERGSRFIVSLSTGALGARLDPAPTREPVAEVEDPPTTVLAGRVLVAEDGPDNQRLIRTILTRAGLTVDIAENGRTAVEKVRAAEEAEAPYDAVLMDIQMPEMDGHAATQALRRAGFARPIIALTAHAMSTDRDRCLAAGCDDVATKPIDRRALLELLAHHIEKAARE
jgi:PAS domain S-box-containing protein